MFLRWPELELDPDAERETDSETQEREDFIETDRNSFTFAPMTPGDGRLIVESAYSFINIGNEGPKHSFPESVFRYGIGDRLELRLGYNFGDGPRPSVGAPRGRHRGQLRYQRRTTGALRIQVHALTRPTPDFALMPHSAFLAQLHTPIGSVEGQTQIRLGYAWGWTLPNGWTFDQALRFGTDREGTDSFALWAPSTVLKIPFGREKRWFTHVEYFGIMTQGKEHDFSKQFIDTGLHYFITPNFEVGTIIAFGINGQSQGVLVNVGFGIRF